MRCIHGNIMIYGHVQDEVRKARRRLLGSCGLKLAVTMCCMSADGSRCDTPRAARNATLLSVTRCIPALTVTMRSSASGGAMAGQSVIQDHSSRDTHLIH